MSRFLAFWRMCAGHAVVGNSAFDKDWQWAFGNPMSAMLGPAVLAFLSGTADIITGSTIANAFLAAFFAFVVTWLVAFLVRLFSLPAEYYYTEKERADRLESIDVRQQAQTHLWALREEGFSLRTKGRRIEEAEVPNWTKTFENWRGVVLQNAAAYSTDLRHSLDPLDKIESYNVEAVRAKIGNHELNVSGMSEILDRIRKFLMSDI